MLLIQSKVRKEKVKTGEKSPLLLWKEKKQYHALKEARRPALHKVRKGKKERGVATHLLESGEGEGEKRGPSERKKHTLYLIFRSAEERVPWLERKGGGPEVADLIRTREGEKRLISTTTTYYSLKEERGKKKGDNHPFSGRREKKDSFSLRCLRGEKEKGADRRRE